MKYNRIAISGTYNTGKTILSLALSDLTGLPRVHARSMNEIALNLLPNKSLETCKFHELMSLGIARFTERCVNESFVNEGFISDGSVLNEVVYGKARLKAGLNPKHSSIKKTIKKMLFAPFINMYIKMAYGFENTVNDYAKKNYDLFIHLNITQSNELNSKSTYFREMYNQIFIKTLDDLNIPYKIFEGNLTDILYKIQDLFDLKYGKNVQEVIKKSINISNDMVKDYKYGLN